jgi:hypothetical protein
MATDDHTPPTDAGKASDIAIEARRVVAEVLEIIESIAGGLEALQRLPEAAPIKGQLDMLRGLITQTAEAVEAFSAVIMPPSA